jgi:hypothetical protein
MGQGGPGGQHQAGLRPVATAPMFRKSRSTKWPLRNASIDRREMTLWVINCRASYGRRGCYATQSCRADRSLSRQLRAKSDILHRGKSASFIVVGPPGYRRNWPQGPAGVQVDATLTSGAGFQ